MNKNKIEKYLITKYMGGSANMPPAQNIKYELEDGYKFAYRKVFGKSYAEKMQESELEKSEKVSIN